ncbi:hypothetical protein SKAU_G00371370 [Synaphobranchus kaupii]|uniref:C2H2-type domain-containing protein n=1 Tax=Synaphobranchus kaupii TaxID=118154 RepID=A0A9Q1EG39_SYNKA|nr:hypothetical protein SKAU_G00371370 [Synaphobranchus kaupii]
METHNKVKFANKKRENNTSAMSTHASSTANSVLSSEVSLSFQDELAATIHGAFEVAVEIAVLEITKLVGQALGDVRDQMHETLRENKSLKQRLQAAEIELSARGTCSVGDESQGQLVVTVGNVSSAVQMQHTQKSPSPQLNSRLKDGKEKLQKDDIPKIKFQIGASSNVAVEESFGFLVAPTETSTRHNGSFSEIREDGRVCSHELDPNLGGEPIPSQELVTAVKGNSPKVYSENLVNFNPEAAPGLCGTSSLCTGAGSPEVEKVKVKEEKSEPDHGSDSGAGSSAGIAEEDHFNPDSLSLAQSKLLEDWRPEPLHLQICTTDPLAPCPSLSLPDPPIFAPDAPDQNTLAPETSGPSIFPSPFSNSYQPAETVGLSTSQLPYASQIGGASSASIAPPRMHVCKVCGEAFHLPGELRRHHSQRHNPKPNRNPKRQIFPPGRSPYHCTQCGRDFNRMENLKTHLRIHTGERPYACSVCGVRFRHSGALTRHFRIHTGEKPYACSQCGKTFRNCGGLRFHQRSHTREGQGMGD